MCKWHGIKHKKKGENHAREKTHANSREDTGRTGKSQ
jgi:hypothetical protein